MSEFKAFHPNNETLGVALISIIKVMQHRGIDELLNKYGIDEIKPESWYAQQIELNILKDINMMMDFVAIGMKIPDTVEYGVEVKTIEDALTLLDKGYQYNHRGPDIGGFLYRWIGRRSIKMTCHTPYPSDMEYGILYRLVQKFRPDDSGGFSVIRDPEAPNRKLGDDTCTFDISW